MNESVHYIPNLFWVDRSYNGEWSTYNTSTKRAVVEDVISDGMLKDLA